MKRICLFTSAALLLGAVAAHAGGDPAKGKVVFRKCQSCHSLGEGQNRTGPTLFHIVGRPIASVEGFHYSEAMRAFAGGGKVWDEATLATYLPAPRDVVDGTRMMFVGLKKPEDVANVIAYLENPTAAE